MLNAPSTPFVPVLVFRVKLLESAFAGNKIVDDLPVRYEDIGRRQKYGTVDST